MTHHTILEQVLSYAILALFVLWIVAEVLNIRAKVRGWFAGRQSRIHADETLAEMYTVHEYAGTRAETQRRQRGG